MKPLVKIVSAAVLLFGILYLLPACALAAGNSGTGGAIAADPVGQAGTEGQKQEFQNKQETEIENIASGLFTKKTDTVIDAKQDEIKKLKQRIFVEPNRPDNEFKDMEKMLFTHDYIVKNTIGSNSSRDHLKSMMKLTAFSGVAAAALAGIYAILRIRLKKRRENHAE